MSRALAEKQQVLNQPRKIRGQKTLAMGIVVFDHYYDVVKRVSSLAGQWPYQRPKTRLLCVGLVTLSILSMNVPQMAKFVTCERDLQCIFETMTSLMLATMCLVKLYTCYINRHKMKHLTDHLFVDWNALETSEEYKIMTKYAKNSRLYSLGYSLYCFAALCLFLSMSLIPPLLDVVLPLNKSRPILLTYPGYYFVDEKDYFFYIFLHAVVAWEIAMTGIVAHDCIFVTYVEHVCGTFAIVGFRFKRLFCNRDNQVKTQSIGNTYCKRVAFIVHAHQEALRYAQLLEDTFSVPFAMQILIVTIGMSITLLQIMQQKDSSNILETMRYAVYVIGELIHLFFLCFEGQKLIDHSLQIRDKMFYKLQCRTVRYSHPFSNSRSI
ncbi:PREDICTED: uncharacterized protein LOC105560680 isoform X2 [Vollenhovia emeryi]|uniref:uncharacterized protein LOC105560680 isoform X2 n=1 Tax=Vollenhovia emeryi TaxID=411798 RepID=UPI0005F3D29C|nr:PREDICTED: uncharacterized protein LOC105560680 isoform X2 [Vollenhovia emeryi]